MCWNINVSSSVAPVRIYSRGSDLSITENTAQRRLFRHKGEEVEEVWWKKLHVYVYVHPVYLTDFLYKKSFLKK